MTRKQNKAVPTAAGEPASPACLAHETDDGYAGFLDRDELIGFLNELLEAERAGAEASKAFRKNVGDRQVIELLDKIAADEASFCKQLSELIDRLGGSPSGEVGHFYKRAVAVESLGDRLSLLTRGQGWVVDRVCEVLPRVRDDDVHARLKQIAAAHEQNKERCEHLVGPQQAGA